jgi:O-antigen/teichoic acid export membrane protein
MTEAVDETEITELETPEIAAQGPSHSGFLTKIAAVFATRLSVLVLSLLQSLVIARLLPVDDRGAYVAVVTLPGMLMALAMFGLPNAVNYYAGRGSSVRSLTRASIIFTIGITVVPLAVVWFALPWLEQNILKAAPDYLARIMLLIVPAGVLTAFGGTLLYGRQQVRVYNAVLVFQAVASLLGALVLVGVFRTGVNGAVATNVIITLVMVAVIMIEVARLGARDRSGPPASLRSLFSYGARLYPASVSGYFNYRADNNIIQAMAPTTAAAKSQLSYYSLAVTMAEVVFVAPNAVATMFLPRVAASTDKEAAAMLGQVSRMTLLISIVAALALIPAAFLGVYLVLPKYKDSLPAFLAILPGVVALSIAKVMTSYIGGRGRPGPASIGATIALIVNVPLNIALIPVLGIVGASISSVVSYSLLALLMVLVATRMSGQSFASLCIPRGSDVRIMVAGFARAAGRIRSRVRSGSADAAG